MALGEKNKKIQKKTNKKTSDWLKKRINK